MRTATGITALLAVIPALLPLHAQPPNAADQPTLDAVLARAGAYVVDFQRQLSGIVAEEHYLQDVRMSLPTGPSRFALPAAASHRELKSDFLLVRPVGADRWIEFRDVFEVDGKPVRDRSERLAKLFLEPTRSTVDQVEQIVAESTRHNLGNIQRTINVPVLPLLVLSPPHQQRFRFRRTTDVKPPMARDTDTFNVPPDTWVVQYDEVEKQTMIRTTNGRDLPAHGRFWIEPATGRVLMSELIAEDVVLRGWVVVSYQAEPLVGLLVPAEMRERYIIRKDGLRIDGDATYSHFRQFQVKVDEKLAPIVKP
jgi:hypothetical protein